MRERNGTAARRPAASGSATLGLGLIVFGAILGGLILLWALASLVQGQLTAGGFFFGLILLALLCLPLAGAGWYIRSRGSAESAEMASFAARQAVLDNDRVVRRQLARDLDQRAVALLQAADGLPPAEASLVQGAARRLREVVEEVSRPGYDATTWLSETAPNLEAAGLQAIHRYDDLVLAEAQRLESLEAELRRHAGATAGAAAGAADARGAVQSLAQGVDQLAAHVRERESLLGMGRQAAAMSPQELLAAGAAPRRQLATPGELHLDDALSYLGSDFLVRARLTYFAGGRTWTAYQLHDGRQERWLEARSSGTELGWYELRPQAAAMDTSAETTTFEGTTFRRQESGAATVSVESAAGRQDGVYVEYARYFADDGGGASPRRLLVERWPDGVRTLLGEPVDVADLQFWSRPPATLPSS